MAPGTVRVISTTVMPAEIIPSTAQIACSRVETRTTGITATSRISARAFSLDQGMAIPSSTMIDQFTLVFRTEFFSIVPSEIVHSFLNGFRAVTECAGQYHQA